MVERSVQPVRQDLDFYRLELGHPLQDHREVVEEVVEQVVEEAAEEEDRRYWRVYGQDLNYPLEV